MDLNYLLIWTVAAGCGLSLLQLPWRVRSLRPAMVPGAILLVLAMAFVLVPDYAGIISGTFFVLFMLVPVWGLSVLNGLIVKKRYRLAQPLACVLAWLRPSPEARRFSRIIHVLQLIRDGQKDRAIGRLKNIADHEDSSDRIARVLLTRLTGNWQEFLDWSSLPRNRGLLFQDPNLLDMRLQALGETGRRQELCREYVRIPASSLPFFGSSRQIMQMKVAAFYGNESLVKQFQQGPLEEFPEDFKRFWRATARHVSGADEQTVQEFQSLAKLRDAGIASAAQRRLETPLPTLTEVPLTPEDEECLQDLLRHAELDVHAERGISRGRRARGTWFLAAVLCLVFLLELPGGSENFENLERMGAMLIPAAAGDGSPWRMVTAAFLHFGPLHLIMNVLGLIVLGRRIETEWGTARMVCTYLVAAVGSIGLTPYFLKTTSLYEPTVLVGASGGVMGLLGGLLLQSLVHLLQGRNRLAGREFLSLLAIVLMQLIFDANTPNVSSEAHLLGMSIGILCGAAWNLIGLIPQRHLLRKPG